MNWDAIGAIGEIVGALAVFASLLYLAKQMRASNIAENQTAQREIIEYIGHLLSQISTSPQLADLWVRGSANDQSLSVSEQTQYRSFLMQLVALWERAYRMREAGNLDEWAWENLSGSRISIMASPGFKIFLRDRRHTYNKDFIEFLDKEMKHAPEDYKPLGIQG